MNTLIVLNTIVSVAGLVCCVFLFRNLRRLRTLTHALGRAVLEDALPLSPLGFDSVEVEPGDTKVIKTKVEVSSFRGRKLVIPSDVAGAFRIDQILVGKASQLPSSNPVPGRMFTEFAQDSTLRFDDAKRGEEISIFVTNTSEEKCKFTVGLYGLASKAKAA